ncbi:MAG TPA: nuclear transport factor 2 family protein [Pararhizobium sp.]|uniref:nuclear transport factor 2 family protein n=1 Tax=Pararhizobium sp. TaxID=1977563 RepID=UPI002C2BC654|nr:nuclear transport factor 2 family protein [Pararhizobium sp.]HTO32973.1 nuclear transport factor 2 family protein [Pararhizobium sp.]
MPIDPVALVERFHAAINALDFDAIDAFFADEASYTSGKVGGLNGRDAIMAGFRRYFAEYSDQVAEDSLIEVLSPVSARAVWHLSATSSLTGLPLQRQGEETITFNGQGRITRVDVTDY